ncbi:MAG TPA: hypothetical protein PK668_26905 [Myxococcota bacterium]|nr:hypothetical protein [Myxococcota bacterium]HRY97158.1 hypothetical protein [Myxococcota bacterium]
MTRSSPAWTLSLALLALALLAPLAGCGGGGGSGDPEPLLAGNVSGALDNETFTAVNGFAVVGADSHTLIGVGDGPLNCASPDQPDPPPGMMASISLPSDAVGTYGSVMITVYVNRSGFQGVGSNDGTVEITASTPESIAGSVSYSASPGGEHTVSLNGTFEVVRCAD